MADTTRILLKISEGVAETRVEIKGIREDVGSIKTKLDRVDERSVETKRDLHHHVESHRSLLRFWIVPLWVAFLAAASSLVVYALTK